MNFNDELETEGYLGQTLNNTSLSRPKAHQSFAPSSERHPFCRSPVQYVTMSPVSFVTPSHQCVCRLVAETLDYIRYL